MFIKYDIMLSQKINKKTFFAIFEGAYLGFKEEKRMVGFFIKRCLELKITILKTPFQTLSVA